MRSFTTYRRHNCARRHRTYQALGRCTWPQARWVSGEGPWAVVASCRRERRAAVLTVDLSATRKAAERQMDLIRSSGCGGACKLRNAEAMGMHRLIHLAALDGSAAGARPLESAA